MKILHAHIRVVTNACLVYGTVLGRCFVNVTAAVAVLRELSNGTVNLVESQVLEQLTKLIKIDQVGSTRTHTFIR